MMNMQPATGGVASRSTATRSDRRARAYLADLDRICAQRDHGLDPLVRMDFIAQHIGESRSTIYRRIKDGRFPAPVKRGSISLWVFSEVECYRIGGGQTYTETTQQRGD